MVSTRVTEITLLCSCRAHIVDGLSEVGQHGHDVQHGLDAEQQLLQVQLPRGQLGLSLHHERLQRGPHP